MPAEDVGRRLEAYVPLFGEVVAIDASLAKNALVVSEASPDRIPLVDSLIAAAAYARGACLVHRDRHMATIPPSVLSQLTLPGPGSHTR